MKRLSALIIAILITGSFNPSRAQGLQLPGISQGDGRAIAIHEEVLRARGLDRQSALEALMIFCSNNFAVPEGFTLTDVTEIQVLENRRSEGLIATGRCRYTREHR